MHDQTAKPALSRRRLLGAATLAGATLIGRRRAPAAEPPHLKTVSPGVITVAINGDMPMTSVKDGKLIGTDGEMIDVIAQKLGLKTQPSLMEWSATVESVKTGRADVMLGNMGWTPARAQVMLITDAIYYAGSFVTMKKSVKLNESIGISDFKGHSIGTVTGFTIVPEMKKVPGTTELKLYDTTDACIRDVTAGRLDFAILDSPTVDYMILQNPGWDLKQIPMKPDATFAQITSKQHTVMGMNQDNPDLFDAVNAGVKWLWATKKNAELMAKYGVKNPDYLQPPEKNPRLGVDRDAQNNVIGPGAHKVKDFSALFA
ncbi:MAG: amino acid ABC transporter substrate-binding protein [Acidisphaera sp.]|nr:amino acid ABC transporter substrate-binding protein [Acidisphaera sp.]